MSDSLKGHAPWLLGEASVPGHMDRSIGLPECSQTGLLRVSNPNKTGGRKLRPFMSESQKSLMVVSNTSYLSEVSLSLQSTPKGGTQALALKGRALSNFCT